MKPLCPQPSGKVVESGWGGVIQSGIEPTGRNFVYLYYILFVKYISIPMQAPPPQMYSWMLLSQPFLHKSGNA